MVYKQAWSIKNYRYVGDVSVSWVLRRRVVGDFPWLGAVVATRALPRHATVVSPGRRVSAPPPILPLCTSL
jgi:hypothetical protein